MDTRMVQPPSTRSAAVRKVLQSICNSGNFIAEDEQCPERILGHVTAAGGGVGCNGRAPCCAHVCSEQGQWPWGLP